MKFLLTTAFLASLAFGQASETDTEDFAYWRDLVDVVNSMPETLAPTESPVAPTTDAPVSLATDSPTTAPVTPVTESPTDAPVTTTIAPVAVVATPAPTVDATGAPTNGCKTIADVLSTTPEFTTLATLVNAAGITDILSEDTLTLFAPTNEAIAALPSELVDSILADTDLLTFVLFGHAVARQEVMLKDLECQGGPISSLSMVNGETAEITCGMSVVAGAEVIDTYIQDSSQLGVPAKVVGPDGVACNGIIQAIDAVIIPQIESPTDVPVSPTPAPVAPVTPTDAPVAPTDAPVAPTDAPVAPTEAPVVPVSPVQSKLAQFALNGGAEFEDTTSYQYKALKQVEAQEGVDTFTDAKLTQYYALYCIYFATNGVPNDITNADPRFEGIPFPNWLVVNGWEETTVDPCDGWYGIVCDSESRVSIIDLFENLLTGAFPAEIVLLSLDGPFATGAGNLFRLDLFRNEFLFNNEDNTWMTDLGSNMTTIIAEETAFTGDIPRLPDSIVNFDISFAFFTGGLTDANFEGLDKIKFIDLDGNAFNSTIPSVFGRLPSLEFLYLSDSFVSGDLSYMEGMPSIREHWMDSNPGITGPIFDFIGDLSTLASWSMAFNSLTGTLPDSLGELTAMTQMWLWANQLTGTIPASLGGLQEMKILQLEGNAFTGSMPAEICANVGFPANIIDTLGADCDDANFECSCCTCCSVLECSSA